MSPGSDGDLSFVLSHFGGDPQRAEGLAAFLGFEPIQSPEDRLAGLLSGQLKQFIRGRDDSNFGVSELYRVGHRETEMGSVGLWVAVLQDWGYRSSDRDRARRRVARGLVTHENDRRTLTFLVPPSTDDRQEAELIFPRLQMGTRGGVTTIRAHLNLEDASRFHRDLLRGLRIPPDATLLEVSRRWQQQFSVERVTTRFYMEYAGVRNRIANALLAQNKDHPEVKSLSQKEARAWATRQMGRVLFLWFLQAKRWLGEPGGHGSPTYLRDLWDKRPGDYFSTILKPLFFDALATGSSSRGENAALGYVPYLNGGLFRRSGLEDRINDAGEVSLPDEVFDPHPDDDEAQKHTLLGLLSRYRFTTRESTPDDQSVDPDPELLGRVFENLYQGDERRSTGTYYTPREIVHFMCREALDGYLRDRARVDQATLNALRQESVGSRDEFQPLANIPADELIDALETLKLCDPAVGSGAFLLGAIQEIVALRRGILYSQRRYVDPHELYQTVSDWKRRIIENSLYGVDLNPEAVEICRLRLWLSMVLDMDEPPDPTSDWALPNLDFQIVAGDSLVDRVAGIAFVGSWPPTEVTVGLELRQEIERLVSNIRIRRQEFDRVHRDPKRLRELRDLIARDQREIVHLHLADAIEKAEEELKGLLEAMEEGTRRITKAALKRAEGLIDRMRSLLSSMELADFALVQKPFLWSVAFPEVLRDGDPNSGFDIVLANPPYVKHEKLDAEDQNSYADAFPEVYAGTADLLVYFYARALQILRPNGWLSFITSNKYMRAAYGVGTREHLPASLHIQRVIDFGDLPLFEANGKAIAAYPAVLVGSRSDGSAKHTLKVADLASPVRRALLGDNLKVNTENVRGVLEDLDGLLTKAEISNFPQVLLKSNGWILEDPALIRLFEQLMNQGTPLGEFSKGRVYRGIVTGLNEAFVIDQAKRDELIEEDPRSAELIKPWLRGQNIKRWEADWTGIYVIAVQNSGDAGSINAWGQETSEEKARAVFRESYPAVHDYLSYFERFKDKNGNEKGLRVRQDRGKFWWELRACAYYHEFAYSKIVWGNLAVESKFARDLSQAYVSAPANLLVEPVPWLLAVMNSSLLNFIYPRLTVARGGSYQEFKIGYIEPAPIVTPEKDAQAELEDLTKEMFGLEDSPKQVEAIEQEIDSIVFHVYGLSAPDRKLVLDWLGERREALGTEMPQDWRKLNTLRATAGAWRDSVDGDKLIEDIYASRLINTRPEPRL